MRGAQLIPKAVRGRLERSAGVGEEKERRKCEPTNLAIYFACLIPFAETEIQQ